MYGMPSQQVSHPTKVVWPTVLFFKFCVLFHMTFCQPLASQHHMGGGLKQLTSYDYTSLLIHSSTDLK